MVAVVAPTRSGVRREMRAAAVIAVAVVVASAVGGVGWGWLAPTERLLVVEPGRGSVLTGESAHQFDAMALFLLAGAVLGLLSAIAAWRWRSARGPLLQIGLLIGSGVGAVVMARLGERVAEWLHPRPHNPPVGQIVALPIELGSTLALIVQPLVASLVMLFLAALSSSADLGTGTRADRADGGSFGTAGAFTPYGDAARGGELPYRGYEPAADALPEFRR
ncbi:DUF2567 domain-containing protein [Nocardia sp. NBC_01730]|uniref:DUF2567 domain-containing protein n=1 Tax=Nocardia sp. NBC_01730 TaxID=2975998 RepID=UPI002E15AD77|nr:DUF2567 domain-containing protein [Nocardia sp. NBC_01730]